MKKKRTNERGKINEQRLARTHAYAAFTGKRAIDGILNFSFFTPIGFLKRFFLRLIFFSTSN